MDVVLRDIDQSNYEAVCDLDVFPEQEDFVACNMWSLVESHYNPGYTCKARYSRLLEHIVAFEGHISNMKLVTKHGQNESSNNLKEIVSRLRING